MTRVYLDYNASTPVCVEAAEAMSQAVTDAWGNPSSGHWAGTEAKNQVEEARGKVAQCLGCGADEVYFTSGGTESNNLAIIGAIEALQEARGVKGHIVTTDIEHPAVMEVMRYLETKGVEVTYLPTGSDGRVKPEDVSAAVKETTLLITIMHANNETGIVQPIKEIASIVKEKNVLFHTDAAQSIGKVPCTVPGLGVDLLSVCSHKFYGPKGVGALYIKKGVTVKKQMHGAGHERGQRPGTENIILVSGMAAALCVATEKLETRAAHMRSMRDKLKALLAEHFVVEVNGDENHALPNTLNCSLGNKAGGTYLNASATIKKVSHLLAISAGSACHSGTTSMSYVHKALGLSRERALGGFRMSTGSCTTEEDIKLAVELLSKGVGL
eukprot:TRINITY_DN7534_c0_g1_i1.p2 TRINITY_DN7534_c0_g1~~TRINITY_DN7534_c0_g1_i1.p2  ORF type:complete len:384 (+),score=84.25 TRINITY_DN7534_c0_g1_i1:34-1185(+)